MKIIVGFFLFFLVLNAEAEQLQETLQHPKPRWMKTKELEQKLQKLEAEEKKRQEDALLKKQQEEALRLAEEETEQKRKREESMNVAPETGTPNKNVLTEDPRILEQRSEDAKRTIDEAIKKLRQKH